jgi:hypothetical protein
MLLCAASVARPADGGLVGGAVEVAGLFVALSAVALVPIVALLAEVLEAVGAEAAPGALEAAGTADAAGLDCAATGPAEANIKTKPKYTTCQYRIIDPLVLAGRIENTTKQFVTSKLQSLGNRKDF